MAKVKTRQDIKNLLAKQVLGGDFLTLDKIIEELSDEEIFNFLSEENKKLAKL